MDKKIYTYGILIVLMVLLAISAAYMIPDKEEVDKMKEEGNREKQPTYYRPGRRGGKVKTISSKGMKKPATRRATPTTRKAAPKQGEDIKKHNPPIPAQEPGD